MLEVSDLEVNVLEFRQRAFSFERLATVADRGIAVFGRTETESESQFRPKLLHLKLAIPQAWIVHDEPNDVLRIARDGSTIPVRLSEPVIEVAAEPPEFQEQGIAWRRAPGPGGTWVYAPAEFAGELLTPAGYAGLGLA